jgi:rhodanese-related sulfurtransferase
VLTGADGSVGRYHRVCRDCRAGNRSAAAAATMAEMGFVEVYDLGGIIDWHAGGLPVVSG